MSKVIGIVSEGPTDYLMLRAVVDKLTGEENRYLSLQPEPDMLGRYGNGWKGVWRWCKESPPLGFLMNEVDPHIDIIIIQMDGDVFRKEKALHCICESTVCDIKGLGFPLYCEKYNKDCPVILPCLSHDNKIEDVVHFTKKIIINSFDNISEDAVIITIPCDSTDTWIVAAYDEYNNPEEIEDPWKNVISKKKYYHDIRVRGDKKNTVTYSLFLKQVTDNWAVVTDKCYSADLFSKQIKEQLMK